MKKIQIYKMPIFITCAFLVIFFTGIILHQNNNESEGESFRMGVLFFFPLSSAHLMTSVNSEKSFLNFEIYISIFISIILISLSRVFLPEIISVNSEYKTRYDNKIFSDIFISIFIFFSLYCVLYWHRIINSNN